MIAYRNINISLIPERGRDLWKCSQELAEVDI
jgi:hypothetical protein